jgi:hypothetical protein
MSTLITAAVLLAFALWAVGSYGRLVRLRRQVTQHWRDVQALRRRRQDPTPADAAPADAEGLDDLSRALEHAERLYNLVATKYNLAITSPPGSVIASAAGFKRAELIGRT